MTELSAEQRTFHLAEYAKLNSEIAEIVKALTDLFKYAVLISGGTFAWLLNNGEPETIPLAKRLLGIGLWVPFGLSVALALLTGAYGIRLAQMGAYLRRLESCLGLAELGWEKHLASGQIVMSQAGKYAWATLLIGNAGVPLAARQFCL